VIGVPVTKLQKVPVTTSLQVSELHMASCGTVSTVRNAAQIANEIAAIFKTEFLTQ